MEIGEVNNKDGLLNEGSIILDLINKQPFGSNEHELMIAFGEDLSKINPELFTKLFNC
ncbi:MAG: hypothetical protein K0R18_329 [Bacillales bacterium]|jgi:hypothetical protein|nr:hypothetical protein [Bacillales bacterium]